MIEHMGYIGISSVQLGKNIKRDINPYGTKTPTEVFLYLLSNLSSMRVGMQKNVDKFGGDVGYYATHALLPNSAENRRDEVSLKPQSNSTNQDKNKQAHGKYGQHYEKYNQILNYLRQKASKVYAEIIDAVKKTKEGIYNAQPKNLKKQPYNPFKKSRLAVKVVQLSNYLRNRIGYPITRRRDYMRTSSTFKNNEQEEGGLEELLKAA